VTLIAFAMNVRYAVSRRKRWMSGEDTMRTFNGPPGSSFTRSHNSTLSAWIRV
jgi:hypothetical protein